MHRKYKVILHGKLLLKSLMCCKMHVVITNIGHLDRVRCIAGQTVCGLK